MFELLADLFAWCFRKLLQAELPDCHLILNELRSGERSTSANSKGYLWLCYLTGSASVVRVAAVGWLVAALVDISLHYHLGWPPWSFDSDPHFVYWELAWPPADPPVAIPWHFCQPLAVMAMATFVITAVSYYGVARLSTELVGVVCPLSDPIEKPANERPTKRGSRKQRPRNEVA